MASFGQIVMLVYALLILLGGIMGYRKGSKASLIASGAITALLLVAYGVSISNLANGLWIGVGLSAVVCVIMGRRLASTKKFMPAGMTLVISVVALLLMLRAVAY